MCLFRLSKHLKLQVSLSIHIVTRLEFKYTYQMLVYLDLHNSTQIFQAIATTSMDVTMLPEIQRDC
jgi:hypothetical protein